MNAELLREYIECILNEKISGIESTPGWANWFHLSSKDLGDEFTFEPRLPSSPFDSLDGIIEDSTTKRTSWAPSIDAALGAIGPQSHINQEWHIYALHDLPGEVNLQDEFTKCNKRVGSPGNEYGIGWKYSEYENQIWDDFVARSDRRTPEEAKKMKAKIKKDLRKCVPDALDTGERWATEPARAKKIGIIKKNQNKITWL